MEKIFDCLCRVSVGEFYRLKSKLFGELLLKSDRSGKTALDTWMAMAGYGGWAGECMG